MNPRRLRLLLVLLLLTALTLVTLDYRSTDSSPYAAVRSAAATVVGPVTGAVGAVTGHLTDWSGSEGELERLRRENAQLRLRLRTGELERERARELDALLNVASIGEYQTIPAQVRALGGAFGFEWTATIDAGSGDGIAEGMTVYNAEGFVGRVIQVAPYSATVLLAIDATSTVGVRMEGTDEMGWVSGHGLAPLSLQLIDTNAQIEPGDRMVTLGAPESSYVYGIPVGEVTSVDYSAQGLPGRATVDAYVDFTSLNLVGVIVESPERDPRDALLLEKSEQGGKTPATDPAGGGDSAGGPGGA